MAGYREVIHYIANIAISLIDPKRRSKSASLRLFTAVITVLHAVATFSAACLALR